MHTFHDAASFVGKKKKEEEEELGHDFVRPLLTVWTRKLIVTSNLSVTLPGSSCSVFLRPRLCV